jgi:selenide,water dikinase
MLDIDHTALPIHPNALEMYAKGETTGSNAANRKLVDGQLEMAAGLTAEQEELLFDPQTSGGLLLAVPTDDADACLRELHAAGIGQAAIIGQARTNARAGIRVI